jgi:hypothetical protein
VQQISAYHETDEECKFSAINKEMESFERLGDHTLAGFIAGPVYFAPRKLRETLERLVIQVLLTPLFGPRMFAAKTINTTMKVRTPSTKAPR